MCLSLQNVLLVCDGGKQQSQWTKQKYLTLLLVVVRGWSTVWVVGPDLPSSERKRSVAVLLPFSWSTSQSPPLDFLLWKYFTNLVFNLGMSFASSSTSRGNEYAAAISAGLPAFALHCTFTFVSNESKRRRRPCPRRVDRLQMKQTSEDWMRF